VTQQLLWQGVPEFCLLHLHGHTVNSTRRRRILRQLLSWSSDLEVLGAAAEEAMVAVTQTLADWFHIHEINQCWKARTEPWHPSMILVELKIFFWHWYHPLATLMTCLNFGIGGLHQLGHDPEICWKLHVNTKAMILPIWYMSWGCWAMNLIRNCVMAWLWRDQGRGQAFARGLQKS
jgi:hypothetical protein